MNLQRIYEEQTNDFIKEKLNKALTNREKKAKLEKEIQNSFIRNIEIRSKFRETII
jgi:hypothetical protein